MVAVTISVYPGLKFPFILDFPNGTGWLVSRQLKWGRPETVPKNFYSPQGTSPRLGKSRVQAAQTRETEIFPPACASASATCVTVKLPGMRDSGILLHVLGPYERLHVRNCHLPAERAGRFRVPPDPALGPFGPSARRSEGREEGRGC